LNTGDMKAAWQNGLADEVVRSFEEQPAWAAALV
jgi:hypothetical protein